MDKIQIIKAEKPETSQERLIKLRQLVDNEFFSDNLCETYIDDLTLSIKRLEIAFNFPQLSRS
jgi:hypothetical protein